MKKIKYTSLLILILISLFCFVGRVRAAEYWDGNVGTTSSAVYGSGNWSPRGVGFRVTVYNSNGVSKYSGVVVSDKARTANYYSRPIFKGTALSAGKVSNYAAGKYDELDTLDLSQYRNVYSIDGGSYPRNLGYDNSVNNGYTFKKYSGESTSHWHSLKTILSNQSYKLMNDLLTAIGATNLESDDYILIEPLLFIGTTKVSTEKYSCLKRVFKYDWDCGDDACPPASYTESRVEISIALLNKMPKIPKKYKLRDVQYSSCKLIYTEDKTYFVTAYEFYASLTGNTYSCSSGTGFATCYQSVMKNLATSLSFDNTLSTFKTLSNYSNQINCIKDKYGGCSIGWYRYNQIAPEGKIKVEKKNSETKSPISASATFELHSGSCSGTTVASGSTSGGSITFDNLNPGTSYYLVERSAPSGYEQPSNNCVKENIQVTAGATNTVTIYNTPNCATKLSDMASKTKENLINLWKQYPSNTNLLNFSNPSCSVATCTSPSSSCLNVSYAESSFSENNWSCYTDTIDYNGKTGFCSTTFTLNPSASYNNQSDKISNGTISGQLYFDVINGELLTGTFNRTCYFADNLGDTRIASGKLSDYITSVSFNNNSLDINNDLEVNLNGSGRQFNYSTSSIVYKIPAVYANNITGSPRNSSCIYNSCKILGYGILSKLNSKGNIDIPFKVNLGFDIKEVINNNSSIQVNKINSFENTCTYKSNSGLITEKDALQLVFRSIDSNEAFPSKNGSYRLPGFNWSTNSLDINGDGKYNRDDYNQISSSIETLKYSSKYDINNDGVVDSKDLDMMRLYLLLEDKNYILANKVDAYANQILMYSPNSYGMIPGTEKKAEPRYKIVLTSKDIQDIREYNKTHSYDDYNMYCAPGGEVCKSFYLDTLSYLNILQDRNNNPKVKLYDEVLKDYNSKDKG